MIAERKTNRKFRFAVIAIVVISVTTIILKFDAATYVSLVGLIVGIFMNSQTHADLKGGKDEIVGKS